MGAAAELRPILARAKTDNEGRFRLEVAGGILPPRTHRAVWAYQPGKALAAEDLNRRKPPLEEPITLTLGPPSRVAVLVAGPDGKPVAGASVRPGMLQINEGPPVAFGFFVPDELAERIGGKTDADGRAWIKATASRGIKTICEGPPMRDPVSAPERPR
jgi:hypothetical protein